MGISHGPSLHILISVLLRLAKWTCLFRWDLGFWPSLQYVVLHLRGKTGVPPCIQGHRPSPRVRTL